MGLPFEQVKEPRSNRILELIHSDVCGPMSVPAHDGSRYFVTFTDNYSRASIIYCIKRKSEVFEKFKHYIAISEVMHGYKVSKLRADNGDEYISNEIKKICSERGICLDYTVVIRK